MVDNQNELWDLLNGKPKPNEKAEVPWIKVSEKLPNHQTVVTFVDRWGCMDCGTFYAEGNDTFYLSSPDDGAPFFMGSEEYLSTEDVIFWIDLKIPEYNYDYNDHGGFTH